MDREKEKDVKVQKEMKNEKQSLADFNLPLEGIEATLLHFTRAHDLSVGS